MAFHRKFDRKLIGWIIVTVAQGVWALALIIMLSIRVHAKNNSYMDPMDSMPDMMSTESSFDMDESTDKMCDDSTMNMVRQYYVVSIVLSSAFLLLSTLFGLGIKSTLNDSLKSHQDMDVALTIVCAVVYVVTLGDGGVEKDFAVVMGLFIILRCVGIYLSSHYLYDEDVADIRNLTVNYNRSSTAAVDATSTMSETIQI